MPVSRAMSACVAFAAAILASVARSMISAYCSSRSPSAECSTTASVLGVGRSTRPSCASRRSASRTGVALTPSRIASPRSVRRSPGRMRRVAIASLIAR